VIAAGNPLPGQLAALCQRLGAARHGITVWPAADIPAEWASVVAHRDAPAPAGGPERFAPLAVVLPDVDGAWFALAGLSSAAGESHLHVVGIGLPPPAGRFEYNWTAWSSWTGTPTSSTPPTSRTGRSPRWTSPSPPAAAPGR
jgi:hypothetical protein